MKKEMTNTINTKGKVWKVGDVAILKRRGGRGEFSKQCKVQVVFPGTYDFKTGKFVKNNSELMVRVIDLMKNESPEWSSYIKAYDKQIMEDFLNGKIAFERGKKSDALRSVLVLLPNEIKEIGSRKSRVKKVELGTHHVIRILLTDYYELKQKADSNQITVACLLYDVLQSQLKELKPRIVYARFEEALGLLGDFLFDSNFIACESGTGIGITIKESNDKTKVIRIRLIDYNELEQIAYLAHASIGGIIHYLISSSVPS